MSEDKEIDEMKDLNIEDLDSVSGGYTSHDRPVKTCPKCGFKTYNIETKVCSHCGYRSSVRR